MRRCAAREGLSHSRTPTVRAAPRRGYPPSPGSRSHAELQPRVTCADQRPAAIWVGRAPSGECVYVNQEFNRILGITPPGSAARGNYVAPYGVHLPDGRPYPESEMPYERVMRARAAVIVDDIVIH